MDDVARDPLVEFARSLPGVLDESALNELATRLRPFLAEAQQSEARARLYSAAEAAELVGVSVETVRRAIRSGELRVAGRVGRSPRLSVTPSTPGSPRRSRSPRPDRVVAPVVDNRFCLNIPFGLRSTIGSRDGDPEANA